MKQLFTVLFFGVSTCLLAQTSKTTTTQTPAATDKVEVKNSTPSAEVSQPPANPRTASTSTQATIVKVPYDVTDKYMGRKDEFLNLIILPELPADFPLYDPRWTLDDYNIVVDAYFIMHKEILKDKPKEKLKGR
jgi:hypothetical protein